jgi:hypothetical protein
MRPSVGGGGGRNRAGIDCPRAPDKKHRDRSRPGPHSLGPPGLAERAPRGCHSEAVRSGQGKLREESPRSQHCHSEGSEESQHYRNQLPRPFFRQLTDSGGQHGALVILNDSEEFPQQQPVARTWFFKSAAFRGVKCQFLSRTADLKSEVCATLLPSCRRAGGRGKPPRRIGHDDQGKRKQNGKKVESQNLGESLKSGSRNEWHKNS